MTTAQQQSHRRKIGPPVYEHGQWYQMMLVTQEPSLQWVKSLAPHSTIVSELTYHDNTMTVVL